MLKISIIGLGMVGGALQKWFLRQNNIAIFGYDKYKKIGSIDDVNEADFIFVAVPTPYDQEEKKYNLSAILEVLPQIKKNKIVIIKSTMLPGTTEELQRKFPKLYLLFNPEFLTEESADNDMSYPDRQIVGYIKESYRYALEVMQLLPMAPFERIMPATDAEMVKLMGNCWFNCKVSYVNEIYDICEKVGADYENVKAGVAADKRIGRSHLEIWHKGYRGYGGKCLPKDGNALLALAEKLKVNMPTLTGAKIKNKELNNERY